VLWLRIGTPLGSIEFERATGHLCGIYVLCASSDSSDS
jgi:hypothetical protein